MRRIEKYGDFGYVRSGEGDEIDIVSIEDGHLVARIRSAEPAPPVR